MYMVCRHDLCLSLWLKTMQSSVHTGASYARGTMLCTMEDFAVQDKAWGHTGCRSTKAFDDMLGMEIVVKGESHCDHARQ